MGRIGKHTEDISGMTFNRLTVIAKSDKTDRSKSIWWDCVCNCGTAKTLKGNEIRSGIIKSCGCLKADKFREVGKSNRQDIAGCVFGRLTVLRDSGQRINGRILWECQCSCGKLSLAAGSNLLGGSIQSCGCYRKEKYLKDIIGQVFGRLTVIKDSGERNSGAWWSCRCECGSICKVKGAELRKGTTKSCGCLRHDVAHNRKDITGLVSGRLTVIGLSDRRAGRSLIWRCRCECGNTTEVRGRELRNGSTLSCGCLMRETTGKLRRTHGLSNTEEYKRFLKTKREMAKLKRTPRWADMDAIKDFYINRPKGMTIDHIIPFQGKLVSGLHVPNNLQYLTLSENSSKGNKFTPITV